MTPPASSLRPGGRGLPGVVIFSPLPPQPNGIADYTHELLGALGRRIRCLVVVEDKVRNPEAPRTVEVIGEAEYRSRAGSLAAVPHLYQVGNNPDHVYMLPYAAERPGVLVLHDPSLHYLLDRATLGRGDADAYTAALRAEYGAAGVLLGEQFRAFGLRDGRMFSDLPMIGALAGRAGSVIVHSRFAAAKVLARAPEARVHVVQHHFCPPPVDTMQPREDVRRRAGVGEDEVMFLSLGFATRAKLIDRALRALAAMRGRLPPFRYVIAGELRPDEIDLEAVVRELGSGLID